VYPPYIPLGWVWCTNSVLYVGIPPAPGYTTVHTLLMSVCATVDHGLMYGGEEA